MATSTGWTPTQKLHVPKGLEGVVVAETALSEVDGENGRLVYRGYEIADLAHGASFEEVVYLLWEGHLPTRAELTNLRKQMAAHRTLPDAVTTTVHTLPGTSDPMDVLRTGASALGAALKFSGPASIEHAMILTAAFPTIVATYHRHRNGQPPIPPREDLGHAANYLYMLTGEVPSEQRAKSLDTYLVLTADHGLNASTFAARVIASTLADMDSAIVGAVGAR
jgi:citrate synthase